MKPEPQTAFPLHPEHITPADWERNNPYAQPTTDADWGGDWEAYQAAYERAQAERTRERWALDVGEGR
ncbi:MAG TPA: hypothetical protein VF276_10120 [Chloroflexia bacterium]